VYLHGDTKLPFVHRDCNLFQVYNALSDPNEITNFQSIQFAIAITNSEYNVDFKVWPESHKDWKDQVEKLLKDGYIPNLTKTVVMNSWTQHSSSQIANPKEMQRLWLYAQYGVKFNDTMHSLH